MVPWHCFKTTYLIISNTSHNFTSRKLHEPTDCKQNALLTFVIFHSSIPSPTKHETLITKFVSLSSTYRRTTTDWNTLKNTERTDKPSRLWRLFQNWMSERKIHDKMQRLNIVIYSLKLKIIFSSVSLANKWKSIAYVAAPS